MYQQVMTSAAMRNERPTMRPVRSSWRATPGHERQQDKRIEPQGVAEVGRGPGRPRVAKRERERPAALQREAAPEVPGHRGVHARKFERDDHIDGEREMRLVEQQNDEVEGTREVVAVQPPGI